MTLNLFKHRGFWYYGRTREYEELTIARELCQDSDVILDVGANIGYLTLYYRWVAPKATILAVEPSPANLSYLRLNTRGAVAIHVLPVAAGAESGTATLYEEDLTGQNNSLIKGFQVFERNRQTSWAVQSTVVPCNVEVRTLDSICRAMEISPDFVKIDVEGFECEVLRGAAVMLRVHRPALQVEVQHKVSDVLSVLASLDYVVLSRAEAHQLIEQPRPRVVFAFPAEVLDVRSAAVRAATAHGFSRIV